MEHDSERHLDVVDWGVIDYQEALSRQRELFADRIADRAPDTIIVCEHPSVITCGTSAQPRSLRTNREQLSQLKIPVVEVERGGDVTTHGPGQLVCYPIIDLRHYRTDVGWYLRTLEGVIIELLALFEIQGLRIAGKTGVWVSSQLKIASLGVKLSRWRTMHGFSVNVSTESEETFSHIVPCGLPDIQVTSIERVLGRAPNAERVKRELSRIISTTLKSARSRDEKSDDTTVCSR
jgi:lipoyl(octanoyl) transferase